ncbi:MAG: cell wall hydrolase [Clostridia bacterium]|nr:cell wall hydrolase [Clostridia bacterium]
MRKMIAAAVLLALLVCALVPSVSFTEDRDTILLARTIYALGKAESYETKLALGTVVMNRLENNWFADSLGEVLRDQQQFPSGSRYDDDSLRAAHEVLSGKRTLDSSALYYQSADASRSWGSENRVDSVGGYNFYSESGNV